MDWEKLLGNSVVKFWQTANKGQKQNVLGHFYLLYTLVYANFLHEEPV